MDHAHLDQTPLIGSTRPRPVAPEARSPVGRVMLTLQQSAGNRAVTTLLSSAATPYVQRFRVNLGFAQDPEIPKAIISDVAFHDRPGDTYLEGGDPRGTRRHLISMALEFDAMKKRFVNKTVEAAADELGVGKTKQGVEEGIKSLLANQKNSRYVYQGSQGGNDSLNFIAEQGKKALVVASDRPATLLALNLIYCSTIDLPGSFAKVDERSVLVRHMQLFEQAYGESMAKFGIGKAEVADLGARTLFAGDRFRTGDEVASRLRSSAEAAQIGAGGQAAFQFHSFKLPGFAGGQRQPQLSLPDPQVKRRRTDVESPAIAPPPLSGGGPGPGRLLLPWAGFDRPASPSPHSGGSGPGRFLLPPPSFGPGPPVPTSPTSGGGSGPSPLPFSSGGPGPIMLPPPQLGSGSPAALPALSPGPFWSGPPMVWRPPPAPDPDPDAHT